MLYQYTATDQNAAVTRGSIDAPTLDQARQMLIDRGMEVTELSEARQVHTHGDQEHRQPMLKTTFAFEGADTSGVIRRGTLQAEGKYEAFEHLRESQNLTLSMLSPVGVTPQYHDRDLEMWQKRGKKSQPQTPSAPPVPVAPSTARTIGFSGTTIPRDLPKAPTPATVSTTIYKESNYTSIFSTLRLYAGWLLAWYAVFVSLGYYVHTRALPFSIPFVEAFYLSSLMFSITLASFVFLLLSSIHRITQVSRITGIMLGIVGIALFLVLQALLPW
jgi:hypothetical protein